jgi:hypothetical protein
MMHHLNSSRVWIVALLASAVLSIGGCTKKQNPVSANGGPDTPAPPAGTISDEARLAVFDTLNTFLSTLPGTNASADNQATLAYLQRRPEFEASGISPDGGNVWARFVDGTPFLVLNDRAPGTGSQGVLRGQLVPKPDVLRKSSDVFPGASKARIMNSLGTAFPASAQTVTMLRSWCKQVGYTLSTPDDPTIENLLFMNGDGIFYWTTHGGTGYNHQLVMQPIFALWTSDVVTKTNIPKYRTLVDSGYLVYASAKNDLVDGKPVNTVHYMVTMKFIGEYMSFATNSLVYFDACGSGDFDPKYLPLLKTAGFYLGWSLPTRDDESAFTARYFFDKTLGVNSLAPKETPPRRPFYTGDVLSEMKKYNYDVSGLSHLVHPIEPVLTTLRLLAPSIALTSGDASINTTTYDISGSFTDNQAADGFVLLNDTPVPAPKWTSSNITIPKPTSGGKLVVMVRNVKSNPVNLTEWNGTLDYTFTGDGSLKQHIVVNLNFFADVHSFHANYLSTSGYMPYNLGRTVQWLKSSSCTYECSGEYPDRDSVLLEKWTGSGSLPLIDLGTTGTGFGAYAMIDSAGTNSMFLLNFNGTFTKWTLSGGESQQPLTLSTQTLILQHTMPDFVFKAGEIISGHAALKWGDFTTKYAPDPLAPQ